MTSALWSRTLTPLSSLNRTEKLVLMDAPLPGIYGWEEAFNEPDWHLRFHGPTPEALVKGRERIYFEHYWNDFAFDKSHSIPEEDRTVYTKAYSRPGRIHSGWAISRPLVKQPAKIGASQRQS